MGASTTRAYTWKISPIAFSFITLPITGTTLVYGQPYTQKLLGMGGTGVYTNWSVTAISAMPSGLALNPATGEVSGTPEVTGSINASIRVTDDAGDSFFNVFTFNISRPDRHRRQLRRRVPAWGPTRWVAAIRNLSLSGGTPPYIVEALTPLPPGYTLISGDALLPGAPANSWFLVGHGAGAGGLHVHAAGHRQSRQRRRPHVLVERRGVLAPQQPGVGQWVCRRALPGDAAGVQRHRQRGHMDRASRIWRSRPA